MPIPEDAWCFKPENFKTDFVINMGYLMYSAPGKPKQFPGLPGAYADTIKKPIKLPEGNWQIVCTSKDVTEEVKNILETVIHPNEPVYYKLYDEDSDATATTDFKEAFGSLLRSLNINGNQLILKKL